MKKGQPTDEQIVKRSWKRGRHGGGNGGSTRGVGPEAYRWRTAREKYLTGERL